MGGRIDLVAEGGAGMRNYIDTCLTVAWGAKGSRKRQETTLRVRFRFDSDYWIIGFPALAIRRAGEPLGVRSGFVSPANNRIEVYTKFAVCLRL